MEKTSNRENKIEELLKRIFKVKKNELGVKKINPTEMNKMLKEFKKQSER